MITQYYKNYSSLGEIAVMPTMTLPLKKRKVLCLCNQTLPHLRWPKVY